MLSGLDFPCTSSSGTCNSYFARLETAPRRVSGYRAMRYTVGMLIVANWKAYVEELSRAKDLFALAKRLATKYKIDIVLAPPAPFLGLLASGNRSNVAFAAQDLSLTTGGAETGESTARAFSAAGATYAIVGHSERRAKGETNEMVAEKLAHALAQGLEPILCVGERERDSDGRYLSFVREELSAAFEPLSPKDRAKVTIAYEPVWAIGKTAAFAITATELGEMVLYIRKVLAELLPGKSSAKARILYGGSVEPENARDLAAASAVDGMLIGHASVHPALITAILKELS